ncbi:conserved hypothetical protein [Talaromyces stipitatus ATCC 10500]|uniref:Extracellular serine-rich protein n=1 Tax=Talaromyces stipitatus (strain ATCC 10500 / CBS 375.48 / QM 6759 / NRRL 1006) TaxID=441959 RepID=B8M3E0_TALSN|nr:uncharacterized protein TSTA_095610 [Talaromyces stipitatus ATCC 10500]EED22312.1 conserved hypothetical protein [Talaromyces stipitatus ATCC 10500]
MQLLNTIVSAFLLTAAASAQSATQSAPQASGTAGAGGDVKVHVVQVGLNGSLEFSPNSIQANPGEVVQFQFMAKNHSVVQSAFSDPCAPINTVMSNVTGFKSGFMPVKDSIPVFSVMVNDTKPVWAYCSQVGHCAKGMVFAINAPTTGAKTFSAFQAMAMNGTSSSSTSGSGSGSSGSSSSGSGSGSSSGASGSASGSAAASSSTAVPKAGDGAKPMVDMTMLMLVGVFGLFFAGF